MSDIVLGTGCATVNKREKKNPCLYGDYIEWMRISTNKISKMYNALNGDITNYPKTS